MRTYLACTCRRKCCLPALRRVCAWYNCVARRPCQPLCNRPCRAHRKPAGEAMAGRISELVNAVLRAEEGASALSSAQVLDLIDLGGSPGGSVVRISCRTPLRA